MSVMRIPIAPVLLQSPHITLATSGLRAAGHPELWIEVREDLVPPQQVHWLADALGGAVGVLLGVGGAIGLHVIFPGMPLSVAPWAVVSAFSFSVGVGLVFGVVPARRASRLDPIAALRHE